jgi:hypothetical protein
MAAGFAGDERLPLATAFGRIAFAYILFISLAALLSGVLNATGRFAAAAAAPLLLNVILIIAPDPPRFFRPSVRTRRRGTLPRHAPDGGRAAGGDRATGAGLDRGGARGPASA